METDRQIDTVSIKLNYFMCSTQSLHNILNVLHLKMTRKRGKAVLLQAWIGPEGSRKLRFPDFMKTA